MNGRAWTCAICGRVLLLNPGGPKGTIWRHQRGIRCQNIAKARREKLEALRMRGCDCQDPEPPFGPALKSNECKIHNDGPIVYSTMFPSGPSAGGEQ